MHYMKAKKRFRDNTSCCCLIPLPAKLLWGFTGKAKRGEVGKGEMEESGKAKFAMADLNKLGVDVIMAILKGGEGFVRSLSALKLELRASGTVSVQLVKVMKLTL